METNDLERLMELASQQVEEAFISMYLQHGSDEIDAECIRMVVKQDAETAKELMKTTRRINKYVHDETCRCCHYAIVAVGSRRATECTKEQESALKAAMKIVDSYLDNLS